MQNTAIRTSGRAWDFLEPAMLPERADEDHVMVKLPGAGLYTIYRKGQILLGKNDGTNLFAKIGEGGYAGSPRIVKHTFIINEDGQYQLGDVWFDGAGDVFEGSVNVYFGGFFKCEDLVGAGGTNEVQTETLDAGVDGGTRTLKFGPYTTAPIAWNANAAAIQAALLLLPNLETNDVVVTGTGPYTYTFGGNYAGSNVPLIIVDPALLTDGGGAPATTGSVFVETTPGAGLLTGVGRLVRGTNSVGIMELGAATIV